MVSVLLQISEKDIVVRHLTARKGSKLSLFDRIATELAEDLTPEEMLAELDTLNRCIELEKRFQELNKTLSDIREEWVKNHGFKLRYANPEFIQTKEDSKTSKRDRNLAKNLSEMNEMDSFLSDYHFLARLYGRR